MKKARLLLSLLFVAIALLGCSKSNNQEENLPPPPPEVFSITATKIVVKEAELPQVSNGKIVRADFNMDKLEDLAVAEEDEDGKSAIFIYLQKKGEGFEKSFYKAGRIQESGDYTISALMTHKAKEHIDLLVMFNYLNGGKELVYYRSDGESFREIQREDRSPEAPVESK